LHFLPLGETFRAFAIITPNKLNINQKGMNVSAKTKVSKDRKTFSFLMLMIAAS